MRTMRHDTVPAAIRHLADQLRARRAANPAPLFTIDDHDDAVKNSSQAGKSFDPVERIKPTAELLTIDQAASYLGITDDQTAAFVADGALDYINVGRGAHPLHQARP
jgi:excisionase family DNA binding protein